MFEQMATLKAEGIGRVYVDVWNSGVVYFESKTMQSTVGSTGIGDDHLKWTLDAGNYFGIEVYAWFEYGLMTSYGSIDNDFARYAQANSWILGQYDNAFYWMDPENTDVLRFLAGIMTDAVSTYGPFGLRGVQLDDHFATPDGLGRDKASMDSAMSYIRRAIDEVVATTTLPIVLSLSPCTLDCSKNPYQVYWDEWGSLNYFDEVIPQLYRSTYSAFKTEFDYTEQSLSSATKEKWIASGVRVDGSGAPTPWEDVNNTLSYSNANMKGNVVWYSHGIIELYPSEFAMVWTE
jgi:uncharacterized lipoprotein YddW (UPF0748 family)